MIAIAAEQTHTAMEGLAVQEGAVLQEVIDVLRGDVMRDSVGLVARGEHQIEDIDGLLPQLESLRRSVAPFAQLNHMIVRRESDKRHLEAVTLT